MTLYRPDPVSAEPDVAIHSWMVMELSNGDRHLVGDIQNGHDGRVSSKIMNYADHLITSRRGRRYHLCGPSRGGLSSNAEYVWRMWCRYHRLDPASATDVSDEYAGAELQ